MKNKKWIKAFAALCVGASALATAACNFDFLNKGETPSNTQTFYQQYVAYAEEQGQTPLSYEDWVAFITGESGEIGNENNAEVRIEEFYIDENGHLIVKLTGQEPQDLGEVVFEKDDTVPPEGDDNPEGGDNPSQGENPEGGDNPNQGDNPEGGDNPSQGDNPEGGDNPSTPQQPAFTNTEFSAKDKALFTLYDFDVLPFIPNNEYVLEEYTDTQLGETGLNFYTYGNTQAEFNAYLQMFSSYESAGTDTDEFGDTWYFFDKADYYVDLAWYEDGGEKIVDVYIYRNIEDGGNTDQPEQGGDDTDDVELITNKNKGLPTGTNGVYNVDFTKATYVKNVTEQYYYLDGCPTVGTPKALVIPVEFSDVTAASKGYQISKIKTAFTGGAGTTDYHSVKEYYYQSSYGKLSLDFTVLDSWFRPEKTSSYYKNATMDYYGEQTPIGDQMIMDEALKSLSKTMDLSKFDSDNNGCIDAVVMINTLTIDEEETFNWAYRYWNIYTDSNDYYYEYDGVSANDYLWASYQFLLEKGNGYDNSVTNTYTYIHEFGHILGADDYYDTSYKTDPMQGYDVMDSMTGDHNAYTKFNYGWLTSSRLITGATTVTLNAFSQNGDTIILANNWDNALGAYQEYYILVYYTNNGLNSGNHGYFEDEGIVVYHVDASLYKQVWENKTYYDVYNNNTDVNDEDGYGTKDNLIEFVKSIKGEYVYGVGDGISANVADNNGDKLAFTFTVDSLNGGVATLTFTSTSGGGNSSSGSGESSSDGEYGGELPWV